MKTIEEIKQKIREVKIQCMIKLEVIHVKTYPVIIEQEGDGYIVSCPIFEGCYSQGNTIDEALHNIKEAIELCLE